MCVSIRGSQEPGAPALSLQDRQTLGATVLLFTYPGGFWEQLTISFLGVWKALLPSEPLPGVRWARRGRGQSLSWDFQEFCSPTLGWV